MYLDHCVFEKLVWRILVLPLEYSCDTLKTFLELVQQREILDGSWSYVVVLTIAFVREEGGGEFNMEFMTRCLDRSG
jgi:hypothetical protein